MFRLQAPTLFVACAIAATLTSPLTADPRPHSETERAAVEIAADYLARGPIAVAERLSSQSSMARLPLARQLEEIETRLGPPAGAQWEIDTVVPAIADRTAAFEVTYPSGVDDTLFFDFVRNNGVLKISDIRFLAQPSLTAPLFPPLADPSSPTAKTPPDLRNLAVLLALLAMGASAAAAFTRRNKALSRVAIVFALALIASAAALRFASMRSPVADTARVGGSSDDAQHLAPLLELRRALSSGNGDFNAIAGRCDRGQGRGGIIDLWTAEIRLQQTDTAAAKALLARFPSPSGTPLAEILRGRIALLENDEASAAMSFEHAISLGPGRDGLWMEAAGSLGALGFDDRASRHLERLNRIGSRNADVYYALASLSVSKGNEDDAESLLRKGWALRPVTRAELIDAGEFWGILHRPSVAELIGLGAPADALVDAPGTSTRPVMLPATARAERSGEFLRIHIGDQNLFVPAGVALAPPSTPVVDATAWDREDEQRRLADYERLIAGSHQAAAYAQPALRRRLTQTVLALADRNRWDDVVHLTDGLTPTAEFVPPSVFFMRSEALDRAHRGSDAKSLLIEVAGSKVLQRKRDARAMRELAEMLASHDLYDAAIALYNRAQQIRPNPLIDDRVRQIQMNKRLEHSYDTYSTPHFEIHYPNEAGTAAATQLGTVLERELQRLQSWIPVPAFHTVVVNALSWDDFRSTYTGSDFILGFYNGKITVPVAGVDVEIPEVTNILAHELSHAMIAQATNDQAPHWFQEGLAQRIEERDIHPNAFNMFDDSKLLPIALLDEVISGSPDPEMIGAAYVVAQTDIRYVEARYGREGIRRMLDAFARGATTEDAVAQLSGASLPDFERQLRQWGHSERRVFDNGKDHFGSKG